MSVGQGQMGVWRKTSDTPMSCISFVGEGERERERERNGIWIAPERERENSATRIAVAKPSLLQSTTRSVLAPLVSKPMGLFEPAKGMVHTVLASLLETQRPLQGMRPLM